MPETVSAAAIRDVLESAVELRALHEADLPYAHTLFQNPADRVDSAMLVETWRTIQEKTRIPHIGILIGQRINPQAQGLLASWVSQCATLGEALETFRSNISLMGTFESWSLEEDQNSVTLVFHMMPPLDQCRPAVERSMSALLWWGHWLTDETLNPTRTTFTHAPPIYMELCTHTFGPNTTFDAPRTALTFPRDILDLPVKHANPLLKKIIANRAQSMLESLTAAATLKDKVEAQIAQSLRTGRSDATSIAQALGLSRPSLYRKLSAEGVTFGEVLEGVRKSTAEDLLANESISMDAIAAAVGYKDAASFRKACQRWFGHPPSQHRAALVEKPQ